MAASELRDAQRRTESELEESRTDTSELRNAQDRAEMELEASKTAASELREALVRAEAEMDSQRRAEAEHVESNAVPFDHPVFGQLEAARTELAEARRSGRPRGISRCPVSCRLLLWSSSVVDCE
eukprot:6657912-Pyramimonas_sp.AAC.1